MNISKKLLTLLAIFCVIASVGAVCAADNGDNLGTNYADDMSGYAGSQYEDGGYAGSQYQDDGGWAGSQYNASEENGGWAGSQYNETLENANATNTTHVAAAGEPTNATTNITANATSSQHMLATGNPILLLVGVCAVAGGYAVLRRKE